MFSHVIFNFANLIFGLSFEKKIIGYYVFVGWRVNEFSITPCFLFCSVVTSGPLSFSCSRRRLLIDRCKILYQNCCFLDEWASEIVLWEYETWNFCSKCAEWSNSQDHSSGSHGNQLPLRSCSSETRCFHSYWDGIICFKKGLCFQFKGMTAIWFILLYSRAYKPCLIIRNWSGSF